MTTNLPDNVKAVTEYTVTASDDFNNVYVSRSESFGNAVRLKQDADVIVIPDADVPGLIAALQAAVAGLPLPDAPKAAEPSPSYIIDADDDRWYRDDDGLYALGWYPDTGWRSAYLGYHALTYGDVRARFGIRSEG